MGEQGAASPYTPDRFPPFPLALLNSLTRGLARQGPGISRFLAFGGEKEKGCKRKSVLTANFHAAKS